MTKNVLDTDRIGWLLVKMSTPAFMGMFVQSLYNVVNTIFIGHSKSGMLSIAGLSIVFPLQMVMMGMGMMVGIGGISVISRALGSKDLSKAEQTLGNGLTSGLLLGVISTVLILIFATPLLRLIGASDEVLPYARDYLVIITIGNTINVAGLVLLNFSRAEGNARIGMISQIAGAVLNIILDAVFILGLNMGVKGAALGTIIAQTVSLVILAYFYYSGESFLKLHVRNLRLDLEVLKPMFSIGISAFVQMIASSISAILLLRLVVQYGGDIALSAFGIIQRVFMFATLPASVIGQGVQPILGFNYGAKRYSLVLKSLKYAAISSTIISVVIFIIVFLVPGPIVRIFTTDPELIKAGIHASRLMFLGVPLIGLVFLGSNCFQSTGKAILAFITAFARPVLFMIPAALILPHFLQLDGVLLAFPASDLLSLILTVVLIYAMLKQFQKAAAEEKLKSEANEGTPDDQKAIKDEIIN
jgi:putative MATE family efflux protein